MKFNDGLNKDIERTRLAFFLFMVYMVSFFLHIPSRVSFLGAIRLDLLLVMAIFSIILIAKPEQGDRLKIAWYLKFLFIYSILVLPLTTWPGTVLHTGLPNFIKAAIFFFFTYTLILSERRLRTTVYLFIFVNTIRVLEPLYLNLTQGYWGSTTAFGWDQVNRLSGAPNDVINANGLAFVIASLLPFYHYLFGNRTIWHKLVYWGVLPLFLYAMSLTLSRSGILAVAIIYGAVFLKSDKKMLLSVIAIGAIVIFFASLNDTQRDRYLSIFSDDAKSSSSAEGRFDGMVRDFEVGMKKPLFGHGLGTSKEANWNFGGNAQLAHNLWIEVFQELGIFGLIIFIFYTKEIYRGFKRTSSAIKSNPQCSDFLMRCLPAMQVWLIMNFLFSFASYGLSSYEWYLFGGFSAVLTRLSVKGELVSKKAAVGY